MKPDVLARAIDATATDARPVGQCLNPRLR
jgi:hypothetical protein